MTSTFLRAALAFAAPFLLATAAHAGPPPADPIVNGSFESGYLDGWTNGGAFKWNGGYALDGSYVAVFGGSNQTLGRSFSDTAGRHLTLTYWLKQLSSNTSSFEARWNGALLAGSALTTNGSGYSGATGTWVRYQLQVVTTGADSLLFKANAGNFIGLDAVSLSPTSAVPEPASWLMLAAGGLLLPLVKRRRKA